MGIRLNKIVSILVGFIIILAALTQILTYLELSSTTIIGKIVTATQIPIPLPIVIFLFSIGTLGGYYLGKGKFKSHKVLNIQSAVYGSGEKVIDVTEKLKNLVKDNSLTVPVGNHLAGDPIPGTVKYLEVCYFYGINHRKTTAREGQLLDLP